MNVKQEMFSQDNAYSTDYNNHDYLFGDMFKTEADFGGNFQDEDDKDDDGNESEIDSDKEDAKEDLSAPESGMYRGSSCWLVF